MTSTQTSRKQLQILFDDDNSNPESLQQHFESTDADREKQKDNIEFEADAAAAVKTPQRVTAMKSNY